LDDGIYFIEVNRQNNRKNISTWHDWVFNAVQYHTNITPKRKNTCVRVIFADGHHIDLPIYYEENGYYPQLAHRSEGWITSDPQEFIDWLESQPNIKQLKRTVRYLKAWKNYRESNNTNLKLPSGFALTILAANNFVPKSGKDDVAFMETVRKIRSKLNRFSCKRPTTPKDEDLFKDYSYTRKDNFLKALDSLLNACENASEEANFRTASKYMIDYCFGDRFPLGDNINQRKKAAQIGSLIGSNPLAKKPYAE